MHCSVLIKRRYGSRKEGDFAVPMAVGRRFISLRVPVLFFLAMAMAPSSEAWGKEGHFMVCKIAEKYLTREASEAVAALLPDFAAGELASVCSWADEVRFRYRWSSALHFADTVPGACDFDYSRDCHDTKGDADACVVGAINNYTAQLQTYSQDQPSNYDLTQALMFLAHFVGDVHQPLHVGHVDDLGGNTIIVHWYRRKTNLHHVWDDNIIETAMADFYNNDVMSMLEAIQLNITSYQEEQWASCPQGSTCADRFAEESAGLACEYAYKDVEQDSVLEDDYFYSRRPVVERRLAQGGVRLGALLNRIFSSKSSAK